MPTRHLSRLDPEEVARAVTAYINTTIMARSHPVKPDDDLELAPTSTDGSPEPRRACFAETGSSKLAAVPGSGEPVRRGRTYVLPYTPYAFSCLAAELTASVGHLDVYLHAFLMGLATAAGRVESVRIATWERQVELTARALVDASGDAVVAHLAGVATVTAPLAERQLPSL